MVTNTLMKSSNKNLGFGAAKTLIFWLPDGLVIFFLTEEMFDQFVFIKLAADQYSDLYLEPSAVLL